MGIRLGRQVPDKSHPYGHARIETLATVVVGVFLIAAAVEIGNEAAKTIYSHEDYQPSYLAAIVAGLSIVAKEVLYRYTVWVGRRIKSPAVLANAWHHRSDAFSSVAALIGISAGLINPDWHILDAYAAVFVAFFIIKVGVEILLTSIKELIDTAPAPEVLSQIETCALSVPGVISIHDLKVRTAAGQYQMEIHVVVDGRLSVTEGHRIAKDVELCLKSDVDGAENIIIHIDPYDPEAPEADGHEPPAA